MSSPLLADLTTLRLGGPIGSLIRVTTTADLVDAVRRADDAATEVLLVGGGSNLVVADDGFAATVVLIATSQLRFGVDAGRPFVLVDAGKPWDSVVSASIKAGYGGLECLSGIPGSAGATPVQNVGAYGVEIADLLRSVTLFDRASHTTSTVGADALELGYRTSNLKHRSDRIVTSVSLWLNADDRSQPLRYRELANAMGVAEGGSTSAAAVREQVLALRRGKGMVSDADDHDTWSAGSFFTNPIVDADDATAIFARIHEKIGDDITIPRYPADDGAVKFSAGWLIERAGYSRGYPSPDSPVRLSTKHTLALTNRGNATTEELLDLARDVRAGVHEAFGVWLTPEPVLVGCEL
ncbi:UDP-N-acetylmuramate dehydrogenase [Gordonia sp. TBRC 11910]|uniref:UDP-N-acetylenolpyruvoylglucosamine reductase n=1 Tax=Gordonia asplenii TaxID=2725283 RepID=A0A848KX58_9ACTN|nr:UDP-N-acetylmuramate dehydrogenase [Gordonia asplenii]NMO00771.1 UDP-N-acetylmuramate dehydrogenase [Gordonia asplenii]